MTDTTSTDRLRDLAENLPDDPGVYLFKDAAGKVLYVGKARSLRTRVRTYTRDGADGRYHIQFLLQRIHDLDFIVTETEQEALILENNLIKKYRPRYNVYFKDDKTYVNLRLNVEHPFPRLTVVRRPRRDRAQYFGPFVSAGSVRQTLRTIGRLFPMRTCTDAEMERRTRPCLYYHIKRCPAPCVGKVDAQDYAETVKRVNMFLKGRGNELLKTLRDKMELQSAERRYEEAARTRDQIHSIQRVLEKQRITSPQSAERDVFGVFRDRERLIIQTLSVRDGQVSGGRTYAFDNALMSTEEHLSSFLNQYYQRGTPVPGEVLLSHEIPDAESMQTFLAGRRGHPVKILYPRRGERATLVAMAVRNATIASEEGGRLERNRELLEDLQELLSLHHYPRRIECYDISNIQGVDAVGAGVVFVDGEPSKSHYRNYRIRTVEGADDYAMMREVLERRLSRGIEEGDLPDLLVIDGGRGQLGVALDVIARLGADGVDAVGIAKVRADDGHSRIRGKERMYMKDIREPLLLEGNSPALYLLERIRDEAHRVAIGHHKRVRGKRLGRSSLDDIPGVGDVLKRRLMAEFGSVARIRSARADAIARVPGVSLRLARAIKDSLK
jgi:excinuclease ABC subunit C